MFLDFAHGVARQDVYRVEGARDFEGCEPRAAAGFEFGRLDRVFQHYVGDRYFPTHRVGHAADGGFGDFVLLLKKLLDLARVADS